ncbi:hypothetical protein HYX16_02705 [Candidatus Woesearchaeota archaeon]|nr:hypothetical protein [Candidatus Woesearchaeota archaeon]
MEDVDSRYKEMEELAGNDLSAKIAELFESHKDLAVFWFYKPKFSIGNKSPADYCREGKQGEMEKLVEQLVHGVFP